MLLVSISLGKKTAVCQIRSCSVGWVRVDRKERRKHLRKGILPGNPGRPGCPFAPGVPGNPGKPVSPLEPLIPGFPGYPGRPGSP